MHSINIFLPDVKCSKIKQHCKCEQSYMVAKTNTAQHPASLLQAHHAVLRDKH